MWIMLGSLVLLAIVVLGGVWLKLKRRGMTEASKRKIVSALTKAISQPDPVRRILAVDTVLDLTLTELGFVGTLGEKLQKAGPRIGNLQAVWDAHKLRNRLAHEHDASVHGAETDRAVRALESAIRSLAS